MKNIWSAVLAVFMIVSCVESQTPASDFPHPLRDVAACKTQKGVPLCDPHGYLEGHDLSLIRNYIEDLSTGDQFQRITCTDGTVKGIRVAVAVTDYLDPRPSWSHWAADIGFDFAKFLLNTWSIEDHVCDNSIVMVFFVEDKSISIATSFSLKWLYSNKAFRRIVYIAEKQLSTGDVSGTIALCLKDLTSKLQTFKISFVQILTILFIFSLCVSIFEVRKYFLKKDVYFVAPYLKKLKKIDDLKKPLNSIGAESDKDLINEIVSFKFTNADMSLIYEKSNINVCPICISEMNLEAENLTFENSQAEGQSLNSMIVEDPDDISGFVLEGCEHTFHRSCRDRWVLMHRVACPLCDVKNSAHLRNTTETFDVYKDQPHDFFLHTSYNRYNKLDASTFYFQVSKAIIGIAHQMLTALIVAIDSVGTNLFPNSYGKKNTYLKIQSFEDSVNDNSIYNGDLDISKGKKAENELQNISCPDLSLNEASTADDQSQVYSSELIISVDGNNVDTSNQNDSEEIYSEYEAFFFFMCFQIALKNNANIVKVRSMMENRISNLN